MTEKTLVSWAQNREDILLWRVLGDIANGTYVDVGAAGAEADSVTKLFYDHGWSGLNIEPVASYAADLTSKRERDLTVQVCAGSENSTATLHVFEQTGLSSLDEDSARRAEEAGHSREDIAVDVTTLNQILTDARFGDRDIHFLKIDVEGFERDVLLGLDRTVWRPWVVVVEATAPNSTEQVHHQWEPELLASGYRFCVFDGLNRFYVADEHAELEASLSYPVCPLDPPFVTAPHSAALDAHDQLLKSAQKLQSTHDEVLVELDRVTLLYDEAVVELDRVTLLYDEGVTSNGRLESEVVALRKGVSQMGDELDVIRATLGEQKAIAAAALGEVHQITASTSWRLTRPVRAAADAAKRRRPGKAV